MNRALSLATNLFPIWVLAGGALALVHPAWFTWFSGDFITWGLAVIMLGMGITLSVDDFRRVVKMPRAVGIGFVAHYAIMPFLGWSIAQLLRLETPFAVGLILVSCCPCGTASNVVNYFFSRLLRCDELTSRTISVEVGMQNSGLGAALAREHFTQMPTAALPCAISATFHSVIGSLLAGIWRLRPVRPAQTASAGKTLAAS